MLATAVAQGICESYVTGTRNGTITFHVDAEAGVLRMFSEPEPDPDDWQEALIVIRRLGDGGGLLVCYSDGPADVFEVGLR